MRKTVSLLLTLVILASLVTACSSPSSAGAEDLKDGTYVVDSEGKNEGLKLEVVFEEGKISSVKVLEHNETDGVSDPAIEQMPERIVESNSVNVDTVSGASFTSRGIIEGVKKAIEEAGGDLDQF